MTLVTPDEAAKGKSYFKLWAYDSSLKPEVGRVSAFSCGPLLRGYCISQHASWSSRQGCERWSYCRVVLGGLFVGLPCRA